MSKSKYLKYPFPHCVIDNFFDANTAEQLHEDIISLRLNNANSKFTDKYSSREYNKFAFSNIEQLPPLLQQTFIYLNSKEFMGWEI